MFWRKNLLSHGASKVPHDPPGCQHAAGVNAQTHVIIWADSNNPIYRGE